MKHKLFISYRRADSAITAQFLHRELAGRFGQECIFLDKGIEPGVNYVKKLRDATSACDVLLALIGPDWLQMQDDHGHRRLDKDDDWVRSEISIALGRGIRVIPVVLRGARPPSRRDLPIDIAALADIQAVTLREDDLDAGMNRLLNAIEKQLGLAKDNRLKKGEKINDLLAKARILKNEADKMYLKCVGAADASKYRPAGKAAVDLGIDFKDFDEQAHERKLEEAHALLKEANQLSPTNAEVLLLMAELLIELTPDDPTDEQELLGRIQSLITNPKDDLERFQLAKAKFLLALSGEYLHKELLKDARTAFEKLGRREWLRQCDDILYSTNEIPPPPPTEFQPVGNWLIRDSAALPSTMFIQIFPNGTFRGAQHTPAMEIQADCQGQWGFDPSTRGLHIQGYINGIMPFGLSIFIQGQSQEGWFGTGRDGNGYLISPSR
jgi:hypothetical protein